MASEYSIVKSIRKFIQENWTERGVPIFLENEPYEQSSYFILLSFLRGDTIPISFGTSANAVDRKPGILSFNLYGPTGKGQGVLLRLADSLVDLFQHRIIDSDIVCTTGNVTTIGVVDDINKFVYNISILYRWDALLIIRP